MALKPPIRLALISSLLVGCATHPQDCVRSGPGVGNISVDCPASQARPGQPCGSGEACTLGHCALGVCVCAPVGQSCTIGDDCCSQSCTAVDGGLLCTCNPLTEGACSRSSDCCSGICNDGGSCR